MKIIFILLTSFITNLSIFAQNVGINNPNPQHSLDVTGNLNITGQLLANGSSGNPDQILRKNGGGQLAWMDLDSFKNFKAINSTSTFTVPAGVTKIFAQLWGGGGGGHTGGGGGGGGYGEILLPVSAGQELAITIGAGGLGYILSNSQNPTSGGSTRIKNNSVSGHSDLTIAGGSAASVNFSGFGGSLSGYYENDTFDYVNGQAGLSNYINYQQSSSTSFVENKKYGDGGMSPFQPRSGGYGGQTISTYPGNSSIANIFSRQGVAVGEGGGGGATQGGSGGSGKIILHW